MAFPETVTPSAHNGSMPRERFFVELAPGYVRLRHQLGHRTLYGRRRLGVIEALVVQAMEEADEPLEPVRSVSLPMILTTTPGRRPQPRRRSRKPPRWST